MLQQEEWDKVVHKCPYPITVQQYYSFVAPVSMV